MKEIGGYIELDTFTGKMLHDDGIKLNCGRNALEYLIISKGIKKLLFPKFMCDSCDEILKRNNVSVRYYSIGIDFKLLSVDRDEDEFLYIVNYYGQLSNDYLLSLGDNVIVDNAQAYFNEPIDGTDTIYTCRKFFGVPDGAILYTDKLIYTPLEQSESFQRMLHLLGRYERTASDYYGVFTDNEQQFFYDKLMAMSKLPEGAFMYPLYIDNGEKIRRKLQEQQIFIPTLWPAVYNLCDETELEVDLAKNILPIPVDQRYCVDDMLTIINSINELYGGVL